MMNVSRSATGRFYFRNSTLKIYSFYFAGGRPKNLEIFENADGDVKSKTTVFRNVSRGFLLC